MSEINPYKPPEVEQAGPQSQEIIIERVASGQKLLIYAILINIGATILQLTVHPAMGLLGFVSLALSIIGIVRLATGLGSSMAAKIIYIVLMFIPLVNLIVLLVLNGKATKELRANGYKVGLLGASQ